MQVSIVIPTFNRKLSLLRCLRSMPLNVEVIVVDDGSSDGTEKLLRHFNHPHLIYIRQENRGPASARNAAIGLASGDYIVFTDDDCIPVPPWPWPLIHRLEREDRDVAGVGGKVIPLNNGIISRYYTYHRILEPPESCSYLVTANCAYRTELVRLVGGFDDRIHQPGGEDPGLSFSIRARGFRLIFDSEAIVGHDFRQSLPNFVKTFYRYGKGCAYSCLSEDISVLGFNELMPQPLSISSIRDELNWRWGKYAQDSLPVPERFRFLALALLQRIAYNTGWSRETARQKLISDNAR